MSQLISDARPVNSLLAALPEAEYQRLAAHLKPVSLNRGMFCMKPTPLAEQRLARWLLTLADRLHSDELPVTHEHMADMVGVRRAGITDAVRTLREAGVIESGCGTVTIPDRRKMEAQTCECYAIVKEAIETFSSRKRSW